MVRHGLHWEFLADLCGSPVAYPLLELSPRLGCLAKAWLHALACSGVVTGLNARPLEMPLLEVLWNGGPADNRTGRPIMGAMRIDADKGISSPAKPVSVERYDLPYIQSYSASNAVPWVVMSSSPTREN